LTYYLKRDTDIDVFYGLTKCCDLKRALKTPTKKNKVKLQNEATLIHILPFNFGLSVKE